MEGAYAEDLFGLWYCRHSHDRFHNRYRLGGFHQSYQWYVGVVYPNLQIVTFWNLCFSRYIFLHDRFSCSPVLLMRLLENGCPYPELCPGPDILNTSSKTYYHVDYPAARLVFISSWSSTVSLSFVSMQMTLFGYLIASRMLRASSADDQVKLPSPYQTSILMRVLNADLLVLWDQGTRKLKKVFWASEQSSDSVDARSPQLVRASVMMFLFCLFGRYVSCLGVVAVVLHDPKHLE